MNYWPSVVETHPDNHVLHIFLSCNLSFHSLSPITMQPHYVNKKWSSLDGFYFWPAGKISKPHLILDVPKSSPPQSTLLCMTLYSNVAIDIDNYLDTHHLTPWHLNPAAGTDPAHSWHNKLSYPVNGKETRLYWTLRSTWDVLTRRRMECAL